MVVRDSTTLCLFISLLGLLQLFLIRHPRLFLHDLLLMIVCSSLVMVLHWKLGFLSPIIVASCSSRFVVGKLQDHEGFVWGVLCYYKQMIC